MLQNGASLPLSAPKLGYRRIQGSSTAIYGDAGDAIITEESPIPEGPPQMPGVARPWEQAAQAAEVLRQVIFLAPEKLSSLEIRALGGLSFPQGFR